MGKVLSLVLGLAAILAAAYWYLNGGSFERKPKEGPSAAKTRIESVREKARGFEEDDERRNREMLEKTEGK